jgi:hypothetical protein
MTAVTVMFLVSMTEEKETDECKNGKYGSDCVCMLREKPEKISS